MLYRHGLGGLFAVLLGLLSSNAARADDVVPIPEPSSFTLTLFGLVLAGLVFRPWRKRAS